MWVVLCLTGSFTSESTFRGWCLRITPDGKSIPTCSGIRSLVSLLMLGVVLGYFTERRTGARIIIALAAIPIAIVANAARVAGTGLASELVSPAAAEGFFHTFSGWLMFVVAFAGLLAVQRTLASRDASRTAAVTAPPTRTAEA